MTRRLAVATLSLAVASPLPALAAEATVDPALMAALRRELGPASPEMEGRSPTRVAIASVDLNGDGAPETLARVIGPAYCGSGGCNLLVLERAPDGAYRLRGNLTVTRTPIGILPTASAGWRDLSVRVGGGGIAAYRAAIPFDGERYVRNPTMPPAGPATDAETADMLITDDTPGVTLFEPEP